ncbi:PstS family phosphate ABC transporter substrate-binding protein [Flavobacterium beibuense]|uniref:Putative ABC-type phosphate-transport system, binding lipoprotein component n=1 Tax=Flavobacterium beibuense TaxID=657326 RepID=A0A444WC92_9FLAO|nr:substrate-binding domain-containing protein [Flavobacterium beibuense]RYJ43452.1 putative ABC-type phosphate-transport system, binding lipoprotein component [Flavobacterium beibuense]
MKDKIKYIFFSLLLALTVSGTFYSCKNKTDENGETVIEETLTSGEITILTDNTISPIVEDVLTVFHSVYTRAHIKQVNKTEKEIIQALLNDSASVAVLPRKLTSSEEKYFTNRKITPRVTEFATDAIALLANSRTNDTVVNLEDVLNVLRGKPSGKVKNLVFDNPGSSTVEYMLKMAGVDKLPESGVYSVKNNEEIIKYVHDNAGAIGIIGIDWIVQAPEHLTQYIDEITVLGVDNVKMDGAEKKYYKPNQSNIATGAYPLTRKLYVLNYQTKQGLGMGFEIYISAREGQRIILKSGLLPAEIPTREISVRKKL